MTGIAFQPAQATAVTSVIGRLRLLLTALLALCLIPASSALAQGLVSLHSFNSPTEGKNPIAGLTLGNDGNFYGTTELGGAGGAGTLFDYNPSTGVLTTLYSFSGPDGAYAIGGLALGSDGNFYGTTFAGGPGWTGPGTGNGTIFQYNPTTTTLTTLYSFSGPDGASPFAALVQGSDGNFYGTTEYGGAGWSGPTSGWGTAFVISPISPYPLTTLHTFSYFEGWDPYASLTQGSDGNFYGTVSTGPAAGAGSVFMISPTSPYPVTILQSFTVSDGAFPEGGLVQVGGGNFFGTTPEGGASWTGPPSTGDGAIYMISPISPYPLTPVYSFSGPDGSFPYGGLTLGSDGNLYGATAYGGTSGYGTLFKISPVSPYFLTSLHSFTGFDGYEPIGGLIQGTDGNFYGTTDLGGAYGSGTIFELAVVPPATPTDLTATAGLTQVTLNWSASAGATGYDIYRGTAPGGEAATPIGSVAAPATNFVDTTLTACGTYYYTVAAVNAAATSPQSNEALVTINQVYTSIGVTPGPTLTLDTTTAQQFTAATLDQFGNPMAVQPASFHWSLAVGSVGSLTSGTGTAPPFGLYHSGAVTGSATVKAKSGGMTGTAVVTVIPMPVTVATPASAIPNPAPATMTNLSVLGGFAGTGGEPSLTYTWGSVGPAPVIYSVNGTNAAKNTVVTFAEAGSYTFTVTITSPVGSSTTSSVTVNVDQTFTAIVVTPGPTLTLGPPLPQAQQFTAVANDQFGNAMVPQPTISWTLLAGSVGSVSTGAGTAPPDGLYHSGAVAGSATVKAKSGAIFGTCVVTVN